MPDEKALQAQILRKIAAVLRRWDVQMKGKYRETITPEDGQATREVFALVRRHAGLLRRLLNERGCDHRVRDKLTRLLDEASEGPSGKDLGGLWVRAKVFGGTHLEGGEHSIPGQLCEWAEALEAEAGNLPAVADGLGRRAPVRTPAEGEKAEGQPHHRQLPQQQAVGRAKILLAYEHNQSLPSGQRKTRRTFCNFYHIDEKKSGKGKATLKAIETWSKSPTGKRFVDNFRDSPDGCLWLQELKRSLSNISSPDDAG